MPSTERIPTILINNYLVKGHILFDDNFCTIPTLPAHLIENEIYLCGTIWSNKNHYSKEILGVPLEKSESAFFKIVDVSKPMLPCKFRAAKDKTGSQQKCIYTVNL